MSIADNNITVEFSGTSDIRKMFGEFCCRVFVYRDEILSPIKLTESSVKLVAPPINNVVSPISSAMTEEIEQQQDTSRVIHHSISMIIKAFLDSDKATTFSKNTKEVIYAMTAIADEIFLNMDWKGKKYWEENMLETKFFNTQVAGDEIFNRINQLVSEADPLGTEKAEIYLNMLSLGFKGRFRGTDEEITEINIYRRKLFEFITKHDKEAISVAEYRIFQKEYTFTMPTVRRKLLPDGAIVTYLSVFFLFMFLSVSTMVWLFETRDLNRLLHDVSEIALREHK